jgi:hypothetical protein
MKIVKNVLATVAVASFALAQPAAAATRSYQSLPQSGIQQPVAAERSAAAVADSEAFRGGLGNGLVIILIFGALLAAFAAAGAFGHGKDGTG